MKSACQMQSKNTRTVRGSKTIVEITMICVESLVIKNETSFYS